MVGGGHPGLPEISAGDRPPPATVFLALLGEPSAQGRHVSHKAESNTNAPFVMAAVPSDLGYSAAQLARAMEELFASGRIRVGSYRAADRRQYEAIVVIGAE